MTQRWWMLGIGGLLSGGSQLFAESLAGSFPSAQARTLLVIATPEPSAAVTIALAVLGVAIIGWRLRSRVIA